MTTNESILQKYKDGSASPRSEAARCVNLIEKTGNQVGFPYAHLLWANFDPSKGIQAHFSTHTVTILGKNLAPLYHQLLRYELAEVQERDEGREQTGDSETVVTRVRALQIPDGSPAQFTMPPDDADKNRP